MRQRSYILYNENNEYVANLMCKEHGIDGKIYSKNLEVTYDILLKLCKYPGEFFFIVNTDKEIIFPRGLNFTPPPWDKQYVHIWNNESTIRLYCVDQMIFSDIHLYTDESMHSGKMQMKNIPDKIYKFPEFDIAFLSYDEYYADENFQNLKTRFPRAYRINNVKGIFEAHKAAAKAAESDMFYVVDADAQILPSFDFSYSPHSLDRLSVHVWHSINPVNNLQYGYGGVKLFPTKLLNEYKGDPVDFTTSVSKSFKVMTELSNITRFNTDPYSAWRSGFRECAKLASKIIHNQDNTETEYRLNTWCTIGDGEFGDFVMLGAKEGRDFGIKFAEQPEMLKLINDFSWLEQQFNQG